MPAIYYDTFAGLVPVKLIAYTSADAAATVRGCRIALATVKVLRTVGAYKAGEVLEVHAHHIVEKATRASAFQYVRSANLTR